MGTTADELRRQIKNLAERLEDTHKTLWAEISRDRQRLTLVEGRLNGRAKTAQETIAQVFASGQFEALMARLAAIEKAQIELGRRMLALEMAKRLAEDDEVDDYGSFDDLDEDDDCSHPSEINDTF